MLGVAFTTLALLPIAAMAAPAASEARAPTTVPLVKKTNLQTRGVANIDFLKTQRSAALAKYQRGFSAYERNTGSKHRSNTVQLSKRDSGDVDLTDEDAQLWQGTISVGSPAVEYKVDFDTGSSDLFLPGPDCSENCDGHKTYDPSASSASKDEGQTFSLQYGDGSTVEGEVYSDTVTIAGLKATSQAVGAASQYSTGFASDRFSPDGLMGMAFKEISEYGSNPVFQTLVKDGATTDPVFAFKLSESGSELTIGGVNKDLYTGDFTTVDVTEVGYWQVDMDAVSVGGDSVIDGLSAIIDTGTTLIAGDTDNVAKFYTSIDGAKDASSTLGEGIYTIPCDTDPKVSLTFGGQEFSISADTFNAGAAEEGSSDCVGGVMALDAGDFWIVGDVFLQNVYTQFDAGNNQVGFAELA